MALQPPGHPEAGRESRLILDAGDDLVTESAPDVEGRLYGFGEERFLGFEVVVEAAEADVGGVGDLLDALASLRKQLLGGSDERVPDALATAIDP